MKVVSAIETSPFEPQGNGGRTWRWRRFFHDILHITLSPEAIAEIAVGGLIATVLGVIGTSRSAPASSENARNDARNRRNTRDGSGSCKADDTAYLPLAWG